MAKPSNVTNQEIEDFIRELDDVLYRATNMKDRISRGHCDEIEKPIEKARSLNSIISAMSDLSGTVMTSAEMDEVRRDTERLKAQAAQ